MEKSEYKKLNIIVEELESFSKKILVGSMIEVNESIFSKLDIEKIQKNMDSILKCCELLKADKIKISILLSVSLTALEDLKKSASEFNDYDHFIFSLYANISQILGVLYIIKNSIK